MLYVLEQPQAAPVWKHYVEQDAVVGVCRNAGIGLGVCRGRLDDVSLLLERALHHLPQRRLILYDQNLHTTNLANKSVRKLKRRLACVVF